MAECFLRKGNSTAFAMPMIEQFVLDSLARRRLIKFVNLDSCAENESTSSITRIECCEFLALLRALTISLTRTSKSWRRRSAAL